MKFYKNLYCGESLQKNQKKICSKLRRNAGQLQIYVFVLAENKNQLELFHCAYLQQAYYQKHPPFIIGIAKGYEEALQLLQTIVSEVFIHTGNADIKQYIKERL